MWHYPHYEVVIRHPDGVVWWGRVNASTEAAARAEALRQYRRGQSMTYGGLNTLTFKTNLRQTANDESIL